ncbi:DUF177 domain-containing protein [Jiella sp. MQZ9-1]|uniref:DUF177 domain-containing protein n=1 Tax=Jiella flava TaxID=2816857 RepID=A0A939JXL5_9HYPH|nr:DUF177 domain-containing protein [Jiella flava]MBO0664207.1 DUF177 domain-containing protein [Jiella flava]MCD2472853.1 DUF177 domain-containing protein [Jiella flava]
MTAASPIHIPLQATTLPRDGRGVTFVAEAADRARLATALDVVEVSAFRAEMTARPFRKDGARVNGRLWAKVVQNSVVTLEPVEQVIDESFEATYLRESPQTRRRTDDPVGEIMIDPEGEDPPESFAGDTIDLGERVFEALALAVDPYPRRKGESFASAAPADDEADEAPSPFAVLATLPTDRGGEGD